MRGKLPAVLVAATAVAAVVGVAFGTPPSWLRSVLVFLGVWTAISIAATAIIAAWFRATAHANEALTQGQRRDAWKGELAIR
ncbi:MAG: hypothetical protein HZB56_04820 [Deltaproteobacteria bacterium]|nr:hypothetical protein [Deltaproteobacteria bacterium]